MGCKHEQVAISTLKAKKTHTYLRVVKAGVFVDPERPFIGASPDGLVECECCGKGVIEVKCPGNWDILMVHVRMSNMCYVNTIINSELSCRLPCL